jgi:hypothetical protein
MTMKLVRLVKAGESGEHGCPAVYRDEDDPTVLVIQGVQLGQEAAAQLQQVGCGEAAVVVPVEMLLRAAAFLPAGPARGGRTP